MNVIMGMAWVLPDMVELAFIVFISSFLSTAPSGQEEEEIVAKVLGELGISLSDAWQAHGHSPQAHAAPCPHAAARCCLLLLPYPCCLS